MTALTFSLTLSHIGGNKQYSGQFQQGRISALYGPSGIGKTSILLSIAGLLPDCWGQIALGEQSWLSKAGQLLLPHQRDVAMVFQDDRLFDHLTIYGNLQWVSKRSTDPMTADQVDQLMQDLDIDRMADRPVRLLSGGERKRASLARALVGNPAWLFLDEPFNGLDTHRVQKVTRLLQQEMTRRQGALSIVFVSHHRQDVARLADDVLRMDGFGVHAVTRQEAIEGACLPGQVMSFDPEWQLSDIKIDESLFLQVPGHVGDPGQVVSIFVDARDIALARHDMGPISVRNMIDVVVVDLHRPAQDPAHMMVTMRHDQHILLARITAKSAVEMQLAPGQQIKALIKSVALDHF